MTTKLSARNGSLYLEDSTNASRSFSGYTSTMTLMYNAEATDVTGFGNSAREFVIGGIKDWELTCDGFWSSTANETAAVLDSIHHTANGSTMFKLFPAGSIAGCPLYTACGLLTNHDVSMTADGAATISLTVTARTGSLTRKTTIATDLT